MDTQSSEFMFLALVLPGLFAITLIVEGLWKMTKSISGVFSLIAGIIFLGVTIFAYIAFFK